MIALPAGTRIWLAAGATDMRRGMYGLAALVETVLLENIYGAHVFVFRGRKSDLIKVLWADRDGLCLLRSVSSVVASCGPRRVPDPFI